MITKDETRQLKGMAILAMLCLHLFDTLNPQFSPMVYITGVPLSFFVGQAADFCVFAYCFVSGYGLMAKYESVLNEKGYLRGRVKSLKSFIENYWIVLILFGMVAVLLGKAAEWLVSPFVFLGNAGLFWYSYNGAWWYVSTYVVMVLLSPIVFRMMKKHPIIVACLSVVIYGVTYIIRFKMTGGNFWTQHLSRLGMSYAELMVGSYFYQYRIMDKIAAVWKRIGPSIIRVPLLLIIVFITVVFRRYVPTLFIAPVSGLIFMVSYLLVNRKRELRVSEFFSFMGIHSTNIWLTHMFFYQNQYGGLIYKLKYPVLMLPGLIIVCLIASLVIMRCNQIVVKFDLQKKRKKIE